MSTSTQRLLDACLANKLSDVQELLRSAPPSTYDINARNTADGGCSCLHYAILHNNTDLVRLLLRYGSSPAIQSLEGGSNALHLAAMGENVSILQILLSAPNTSKTLIDSGDYEHWTPLMSAVQGRNIETVRTLLVYGCDIDAYDKTKKRTALHICASDPQQRNNEYEMERVTEMCRLLMSYGADVSKQDAQGKTALHYAVINQNHQLVSVLLNFGASIEISDLTNTTPLSLAEQTDVEFAKYMKNKYDSIKSFRNVFWAHQQPLLRENEKLKAQLEELKNLVSNTLLKLEEENKSLRYSSSQVHKTTQ
jgi:ankyrin repeat protein